MKFPNELHVPTYLPKKNHTNKQTNQQIKKPNKPKIKTKQTNNKQTTTKNSNKQV
jgi:hypothetical protein